MNKAGSKDKLVNVIIVLVLIAVLAAGVYATYGKISEGIKYKAIENGEAEATVEYLAKQSEMTVEDYLAQYGLSVGEAVTAETTETEMLNNMTIENYANYNGQNADEMITGTGLQDKVTKDTLWKDFLPQVPTVSVIGEETFNQFKTQFGFGDEVTADMPWGEFEKLMETAVAVTAAPESEEAPAQEEAPAAEATAVPAE